MSEIIVNSIVALVQSGVAIAQKYGEEVDVQKVMATAAARAGATMSEYNKQLAEQQALFRDG